MENPEPFLLRKAGVGFYNTSQLIMKRLMGNQDKTTPNFFTYVQEPSAIRNLDDRGVRWRFG